MDFIYERTRLSNGVKIETVSGEPRYKGAVWRQIALQIYCENGKQGYREIGHYASGAPFLYGEDSRISISHTEGYLVVATLEAEGEERLSEFTASNALGVDVESGDREKVMKLRERFLTPEEQLLVASDSLEENIIAWTCKEAMLKAGMDPKIDWHHNILITKLPSLSTPGKGQIILGEEIVPLNLLSFRREGFIITVASTR